MGQEFESSNFAKYVDTTGVKEQGQTHSTGLMMDLLNGLGTSVRSHVDGTRQAFGAKVDLSYADNENGAQKVGHAIGDAALFMGAAALTKKLPFVSGFAEGKLSSVAAGGLLGATMPLHDGQSGIDRLYNAGLGAGTMSLVEFGPSALGKLPGISSMAEKSLAGTFARYGVANGTAGLLNTEAQSLMNTGHSASATDLAVGAGTWMALGVAGRQLGNKFESWQAGKAEANAAYLPENAPWQFKNVQDIKAGDLQPGQMLGPGNYRMAFVSEGVERKANIYISQAAADAPAPAPLVTHLHGLNPNGQAEGILPELNYYKLADKDGAVVSMLHGRDGLKALGTYQSFHDTNFGYAKPGPGVAPYSDQIAFDDMMKVIRNHVPNVDTEHIAVSGFSLGGKMANRIAATRPDVVAVASIHGTINKFDEEIMGSALHRRPIDGVFVLGTNDRVLPTAGGKSIFTIGLEQNDLSTPLRQAPFWGEWNGNSNAFTTDTANYIRRDWRSPSGENRVTEYTVRGGAHAIDGAIPKRNLIQAIMGAPKPPEVFDARQRTWDFMLDAISKKAVQQPSADIAKLA